MFLTCRPLCLWDDNKVPIVTDRQKLRTGYNYTVLQTGSLPLGPDNSRDFSIEHRCSSVLIWPQHKRPNAENTLLTDPCFTPKGYKQAERKFKKYGIAFEDIGYLFLTHRHGDHTPNVFCQTKIEPFQAGITGSLKDFVILECPGHSTESRALLFRSILNDIVCIAGDTILDLKWLKAWRYYWPNCYLPDDIVKTWGSVATILSRADTIIPGHGTEIHVNAGLVNNLLASFPNAEYAQKCPDVPRMLRRRLKQLQDISP